MLGRLAKQLQLNEEGKQKMFDYFEKENQNNDTCRPSRRFKKTFTKEARLRRAQEILKKFGGTSSKF